MTGSLVLVKKRRGKERAGSSSSLTTDHLASGALAPSGAPFEKHTQLSNLR
jgi:hypothetical protein